MIDNLPAYPAYRDSELPWVGAIPAHWDVLRNGRLFTHRVETGFPDLPILEVSLRTGVRVRDLVNLKRKQMMTQKEKYKRAVKGDIAYNMMRMWQGALGVAPVDGLVSPAYVVVRPFDGVNSSYYDYLFRTGAYMSEVNKYSRGIVSDRNRLYWNEFKQMPSIIPTRDEQDKIVAFLRAQDRQIARFIRDKRRLIELLNEQKQTIIHRAVTRGLDPNVRLWSSGIDWLGEVPEHWVQKRLRNCISSIRNGVWGEDPTDLNVEDHITCVRVADFDLRQLGISQKKLTIRAVNSKDRVSRLLRDGDLLIEKSGGGDATPVGRVVANNIELKAVCSNFIGRITPNFDVIRSKYLLMVFSLLHNIGLVVPYIKQTTGIQNLDTNQYLSQNIFLPPLDEQDVVLVSIEELLKPIHEANDKALREIDLIREYRERLVSDVVTGKVDVRGWTPAPEDFVVDDEVLAVIGDDENITAEEEDGDAND